MILGNYMTSTLTREFMFVLFLINAQFSDGFNNRAESEPTSQQLNTNAVGLPNKTQKTTPELIREQGYPAEVHHVTTKDGYILELHRIPYGVVGRGRNPANGREARSVVYLQHGIISSSSDWIMNTPDKALAYILADAGYDVWMGNVRGNTYSRRHKVLNPNNDARFWQFSWHEMAKYDAPNSIDYVLKVTQQQKLYYVGFSMGTTIFFTMMDLHPEYNDKVHGMVALGPVTSIANIKGQLSTITPYANILYKLLTAVSVYELLPAGLPLDRLVASLCALNPVPSNPKCLTAIFQLTGTGLDHLNLDFLPLIVSLTPAGSSTKTILHYAQTGAGRFQKFDYGLIENLRRYGQRQPPLYNITRVSTPVAAFQSESDWLAPPEDVKWTLSQLPNVVLKYALPHKNFAHNDFIWANEAVKLVYKPLLKVLEYFKRQTARQ